MKDKGKSFIFILGISIVTLIILVLGSIFFAKDNSLAFSGDGYIITTNSEKVYFKSGTTYKENLNKEYAFVDDNKKDVSVSKESFVHYNDNSIGFMKNGAIMDLESANKSIIPYYNITNKSTITYNNGKYYISTANGDLDFTNILGRISDNKYIVAGKGIKLKLPEVITVVEGNYFEITFIEDGIVKIENQEVSYQTTTQDTYIYVGDKIVINLGSMKVVYDGESEMSLSQITIDGNENIDILPDDKAVKEGENTGGPIENTGNDVIDNPNNNQDNQGNNNDNKDNNDDNDKKEDTSASIELVEASVTTNKIKASFKYNNISNVSGNVVLSIIDISTGNKVYNKVIDKTKETDDITVESLSPDTNYLMTISNNSNNVNTQYFSQAFRTDELGLVLNKVYATSDSLTYTIDYLENSNVSSVTLSLYDSKMNQVGTSLISSKSNNNELTFSNLDSNTSYTAKIDNVVMGNMNYVNVYSLDRTDITLKEAPDATTMEMEAVGKKSTAYLGVSKVTDNDSSIVSYTYKIYDRNYSGDSDNVVLYSKKIDADKNDTTSSSLRLDIKDLPAEYRSLGYYRFSVDITYFDNEKTKVIKNNQISSEFYMTLEEEPQEEEDRVILEFKQDYENTTYNTIVGRIKIKDKGHKLLVKGRDGWVNDTVYTLNYYTGDISSKKRIIYDVDSSNIDEDGNIIIDIEINGLVNNSGYIFELYADQGFDDDTLFLIVDRSFSGTTKADVDKLKFSVDRVNLSTDTNVINFDGTIVATNPDSNDTLAYVTATLYKGSTVEIGNIIGEPITISGNDIFNKNYNFTNNSFGITDVLDLTSKSGDTLYQNYTIALTEAYYESGNLVEVEDNVYTYSISLAYMLGRQLEEPTIIVEPILNGDSDETLDESTIIGYEVTAGASIERLKSLLGDLGIEAINYYIYKLDNSGNETLIKTVSTDSLSTELYFKGINEYNRGGRYVFKYDISIAGLTEKYPTVPVASEEFDPEKQSPLFTMYKSYTNSDSAVYKYKFVDIDDAMHKESDDTYKFYYGIGESTDYLEKELVISDEYQELVIDDLNKDDEYNINFYKEIIDGRPVLVNILEDKFESLQNIDDYDVKYELEYSINDNRLGIHMLSNEFLDRIILYKVVIKSDGVEDYSEIYNRDDLTICPKTGHNDCIVIDYADIERFKAKNSTVSVKAYYDNGLSGIDLYNTDTNLLGKELNHGYVFEDSEHNYLSLKNSGEFKVGYSNSVYNYSVENNNIYIGDLFNENVNNSLGISYLSNGILFKNNGNYYPKGISLDNIDSDDNSFRFDSIIPKVSPNVGVRTISKINLGVTFSGLTVNSLQEQFKLEDNNYYVYVELFDNAELTGDPREGKIKLSLDGNNINIDSFEFDNLLPDYKYYYKLYAYLKQNTGNYEKVELFDAVNTSSYVNSTYEVSTLSAKEIFDVNLYGSGIAFNAKYNTKYTGRNFELQYSASSYKDYNLKVQLFDPNGNDYFANHSTVTMEGKEGSSSIYELSFDRSRKVRGTLGDDFVYGNNYYTLVLTAISNNEDNSELELYRKSLISGGQQLNKIDVSLLNEPEFELGVSSSIEENDDEEDDSVLSSVSATITVTDTDKVILNSEGKASISDYDMTERGKYVVSLINSNNEVERTYESELDASSAQQNVTFTGLASDTYYFVKVDTYIYRNNFELDNKLIPYSAQKIVYTSSTSGVSLGSVSASATANTITLNYTGFSNLDQIKRVDYSISRENGGVVKSGSLKTDPIFTIDSSDPGTNTITFTGLSLINGRTYIIQVGYYKDVAGNEQLFGNNQTYSVKYQK